MSADDEKENPSEAADKDLGAAEEEGAVSEQPQEHSSGIQQVQVKFVPVEDRLMLRLNTTTLVVEIWLTRRLGLPLLEVIDKKIQALQGAGDHSREVADFKKEALVEKTDFGQSFHEEGLARFPEKGPLLPDTINVSHADTRLKLNFKGLNGEGFDLACDLNLLMLISHLMHQSVGRADWQPKAPEPQKEEVAIRSSPPPSRLN